METLPEPLTTVQDPVPELPVRLPPLADDLAIQELLGEGGTGQVLVAHQAVLGRDVAIKRLSRGSPDTTSRRLLHEARMMGSLEHPNIPPVHALGTDATGEPVLVMKRIDGHPWTPGDLERDIRILVDVTAALVHAHARGVVHRDVKPANIMLGPYDEVYLMDWGIAAKAGSPVGRGGTPAYMAPEMFTPGTTHPAMDVYGVGAVLHELLTGRPRNDGTDASDCQLASTQPANPGDGELADLVRSCTRIAGRPDMQHVHDELSAWLSHRGAVLLAETARKRMDELTSPFDVPVLTEALFALRQALLLRPDHAPYLAMLQTLLEAAFDDAVERDVRLEAASGWLDELEHAHPHPDRRQALELARRRAAKSATLAFEADYQVAYDERFRVYARWFGLFGIGSLGALLAGVDHGTHTGGLVFGALFLGSLLVAVTTGWRAVTANQANRANLGGFLLMAVLLNVNRWAGAWRGIELRWVFAVDALLLGAITLTLGFTYGTVTRRLGTTLLGVALLVLLVPRSWTSPLFLVPAVLTPLLFVVALRGGFRRTVPLRRFDR